MKEEQTNFSQFATTLGMIVIILTVLYSEEYYDVWDLIVGIGLSCSIWIYKSELTKTTTNMWLARIGFSVACAVTFSAVLAGLFQLTGYSGFDWQGWGWYSKSYVDVDFKATLCVLPFSWLLIRRPKKK